MSNMLSLLFALHCIVVLVAGSVAITTTRGPRASLACFLVSMISLVGVLIMLDAHALAIAQLLFCAGIGFVTFYVIGIVGVVGTIGDAETPDASEERTAAESISPSWQWLIILLGLAFAIAIGNRLIDLLPGPEHALPQLRPMAERSFEAVGLAVVNDQGIALVGVGLLLLASLIGAGFLARRGVD